MKVTVLAENTVVSEVFACEHGLSLYIETTKHKILFDTGRGELFAKNAAKLGVDLSQVDIAFLSHGHYDHGGGLPIFLTMNTKARIYIQPDAFGPYYSERPGGNIAYIGIDPALKKSDRFVYVGTDLVIDDELRIFAQPPGHDLLSTGNESLLTKIGDEYVPDDFTHEQSLLVSDEGMTLLIAGCAHRGIVNIIENVKQKTSAFPKYVIGGFHLFNPAEKKAEEPALIRDVGIYLKSTEAQFYTCHCTGLEPYQELKKLLGDHINYAATGRVLQLNRGEDL